LVDFNSRDVNVSKAFVVNPENSLAAPLSLCRTSISDKLYTANAFKNESIPRFSSVWTPKMTCSEYQH